MQNYDVENYKVRFSDHYVFQNTKVPPDPERIPVIIGWSGPSRSGTTALLYLLASHPGVDRAYFQPQKTLMRRGSPIFELSQEDRIVCMKEVFDGDGQIGKVTLHDPIKLLLDSGVPPTKIVWVMMLREPLQVFASTKAREPEVTPATISAAQKWTIHLFNTYRNQGIKVIPYVYELARDNEATALRALFRAIGLSEQREWVFDSRAISKKLVPGQLTDLGYFDTNIKETLERRKYIYSENKYTVDESFAEEIRAMCLDDYEEFRELAKRELHL